MAPLPDIDNVYRVCLKWNIDNACNVIHVHAPSSTPGGVNSAITASVTSAMWSPMLQSSKIFQLQITPLFAESPTVLFQTDLSSKWGGGALTGDTIPQVAAVVSKKTALRGRRHRGRTYIGPVSEGTVANGIFTGSQPADIATAWTAFQSALVSHSMEEVVASYKEATALTVTSYSMRTACGTMRRRQDRLAA